jgi:hypothetical protein
VCTGSVSTESLAEGSTGAGVRRPWTLLSAVGAAAHHGFELTEGVGLVWQPELGLPLAGSLWAGQLSLWAVLAGRGGRRWDGLLAVWSGASLGGVLVHFLLWPWRTDRLGIPALTEAEGIRTVRLPLYNAILRVWGVASVLSIAREISPRDRKWALVGFAGLPLLVASARHHFAWIQEQASSNPAWWNRGVRRG